MDSIYVNRIAGTASGRRVRKGFRRADAPSIGRRKERGIAVSLVERAREARALHGCQ